MEVWQIFLFVSLLFAAFGIAWAYSAHLPSSILHYLVDETIPECWMN